MEGIVTMINVNGTMWIIGERVSKPELTNRIVLKDPYLFAQAGNQIQISRLPATGPGTTVPFDKTLFNYPITDQAVMNLYIEGVTGIKMMPPDALPQAPGGSRGNVIDLPRGGGGKRA